jgi:high-affinity iron transporter
MLQSLIITLREGVEAALVVAIAVAYLRKTGRQHLLATVYQAFVSAVIASLLAAWAFSRLNISEDVYGGWTLLASAVFVLSMVLWMNRSARGIKGQIETRLQEEAPANREAGRARWGVFLFVFLMVFREGVETVLLLTAVRLDTSEGILNSAGVLIGLGLAILFGVAFVRGTIRINLRSFFQVTTAILLVVVVQLVLTGLHELSESRVLPSSQTEMRIIGPIVKTDVFFFVTILALAGAMVLMEWRGRKAPSTTGLEGADLRKAKWSARRERLWMMASCTAAGFFILAITAEFIYARSTSALSPAAPLAAVNGFVRIPVALVNDGDLHRFSIESDGVTVRMIVIRRPDQSLATAFDACEICGSQGYYQSGQNVMCKNCASAIFIPTIGVRGGCNPIPIESHLEGDQLVIAADKLLGGARIFRTPSP